MPTGHLIPDTLIREAHIWYTAGPARRIADAAARYGVSKATLVQRFRRLGLAVKPPSPHPTIPEETIREAHAWYTARAERRLEDAAAHFGVHAVTLGQRWKRLGLAAKPAGGRRRRRGAWRVMAYEEVVAAYRAGASVAEIGARCGLLTPAILGILRDAGESCASCGILFRETPEGIAASAGRRVCQDCIEQHGLPVERWEREPVDVVTDYVELAGCYACEGAR